ncbi:MULTISPECIES: hypothetical protein [Olivibacter]|uniref:Uncharacterized protein n=3 Tax=Sphingobacteriaceae TaxID=84566 RepID=F4C3H2_SPHS2|nr:MULTISPECIES: hypothetical protein [Olivibacter]MCL4640280.1 hypothetical protein [Olivibacter sp. UJ_SKK_5.1]MDX3913640.1 hypothetical protein [Pseudosphingobacterium sp.]QEL01408.1 hypothetical protein FKG96_11485 [Olivibacter sp. LS-1]
MKTSLNNVYLLDAYSHNELDTEARLLLDARLIIDSALKDDFFWQEKTYKLIKKYGQQELRKQLKTVEHDFFHNPKHKTLIQRIKRYFQ